MDHIMGWAKVIHALGLNNAERTWFLARLRNETF